MESLLSEKDWQSQFGKRRVWQSSAEGAFLAEPAKMKAEKQLDQTLGAQVIGRQLAQRQACLGRPAENASHPFAENAASRGEVFRRGGGKRDIEIFPIGTEAAGKSSPAAQSVNSGRKIRILSNPLQIEAPKISVRR